MEVLIALPRYEGYGMTPLEAMSCGVPIIAADTGHFRTFLGEDAQEYVVATGDSAAASAILRRLMSNPSARAKYATRLHERARDEFDVQREVAKIQGVYGRLWAGDHSST